MLQNLTGWHALIILAVVLLIFGAAKLPALARSVGQSVRILKDEARTDAGSAITDTDGTTSDPHPTRTTVTTPVSSTAEQAS